MQTHIIFGYGSLINSGSLKVTVPDAKNIQPAYIRGFRRSFSLWDGEGFTHSNLDLAGIPYCAVDITPTQTEERVNGIVFEMSNINFRRLCEREHDYELISTPVYNFHSNQALGDCYVFSANKNNGSFDFGTNKAQQRYLDICLSGALVFGSAFYNEFLRTTFTSNDAPSTTIAEYVE